MDMQRHDSGDDPAGWSLTDSLTGLYTRSGFHERVRQQLANIERDNRMVLLLMVRLNNLQEISDKFGPGEGSAVLQEIAGLLNNAFRNSDLISRIDENLFLVFGQQRSTAGDGILAARFQHRLESNVAAKKKPYDFVVSMTEAKWDPQVDKEIINFLAEMEQRLV